MKRYAHIVGTGSQTPKRVLTNADIEKMVDTSDEWITSRSGIKERHIVSDNEASSDLASAAAVKALAAAGRRPPAPSPPQPRPDPRRPHCRRRCVVL